MESQTQVQTETDEGGVGHTQLRMKCRDCGLHFTVHTWEPDKHSTKTMYCPECGQHEGKFVMWRLDVSDPIFAWVPGAADIVNIT